MSDANAEMMVSVALLRMLFDLPPEYRIMGARDNERTEVVSLLIEASQLERVEAGKPLHLVTPVFRRIEAGDIEIETINIVPSLER